MRTVGKLGEIRRLERERDALYRELAELREAHAPKARLLPLIQQVDEIESRLERLRPSARPRQPEPRPGHSRAVPWRFLLGTGALLVSGAFLGGVLLFGHAGAEASRSAAPVAVRLVRNSLTGRPCTATTGRVVMRWTWAVGRSHDGEVATIAGRGPGVAGAYRRRVVGGRVGLAATSPCVPVGTRWRAVVVAVGSSPARVVVPR